MHTLRWELEAKDRRRAPRVPGVRTRAAWGGVQAGWSRAVNYPKRPSHFAHRFVRLMMKSVAAQEVGIEGFTLLTAIAMTEDAKRYRGPVVFFNQPLMGVCGFTSEKVFFRVRQRCVDTGWLVWIPGKKGVAARYWVAIPEQCDGIQDGPVDEVASESESDAGVITEESGTNRESIGNQLGTNWESIGGTFIPNPNPVPSPTPVVVANNKTRFVPPTVDEVVTYCQQRKNGIDAEHFVSHYTARGWKLNGGQQMKDWKSAVITWEKNGKSRGHPPPNAKQTASDHNRQSAAKALEVLNAARRRNENRPAGSVPGLPWDQDGSGGNAAVG